MQTPLEIQAAVILAFDQYGRILLVRRPSNGRWGFPGGKLEPGENYPGAAIREFREEVGVDVEESDLLWCRTDSGLWEGKRHYVTTFRYRKPVSPDEVWLSHEHDDFVFMEPGEAILDLKLLGYLTLSILTQLATGQRLFEENFQSQICKD